MIDTYNKRIETIEKELAAIKADIQEIVEPEILKVGWVYEDTAGDKWIIFKHHADTPDKEFCFDAISLIHSYLNYFTKTGKNSTYRNSTWDLILSTGRKLEL